MTFHSRIKVVLQEWLNRHPYEIERDGDNELICPEPYGCEPPDHDSCCLIGRTELIIEEIESGDRQLITNPAEKN